MTDDEHVDSSDSPPKSSPSKSSGRKHQRRSSSQGKVVLEQEEAKNPATTVIDMASKNPEQPPEPEVFVKTGEPEEVAIRLEDAYKHYGSGKSRMPVLIGLNMEVKRGQIYGLLGDFTEKEYLDSRVLHERHYFDGLDHA